MALLEHPSRGTIVTVNYDSGFRIPEMVKTRMAVVISPKIKNRERLITVVPLSLTPPDHVMPYHKKIDVPFRLPVRWGRQDRWIKGDMVNAVGFHRADLLRLGKDKSGRRIYQYQTLSPELMNVVERCVLHGMGFSTLTKHLK